MELILVFTILSSIITGEAVKSPKNAFEPKSVMDWSNAAINTEGIICASSVVNKGGVIRIKGSSC